MQMPTAPSVRDSRQSENRNGLRRNLAHVEAFRQLEPRRAGQLRQRTNDGGELVLLE